MRAGYSDALKRRIRRLNDDSVTYIEAIVRKAEDIRQRRDEWEAAGVTRTNVTADDTGRLQLTGTPGAKISSTTSNSFDTDLNYGLPWSVVSYELDETIGPDPVCSKIEIFLDRKNNGGAATFDGEFVLQLYRIDEIYRVPFGSAFDVWTLVPMGLPVSKLAADMATDQELVAFQYSPTGLTGVPAQVIDRYWRPANRKTSGPFGGPATFDPLDPIRGRCIVALVRALGGSNSNVGLGRDSTKNNKDVQAAGTLRHSTLSDYVSNKLQIAGGTGEVRCSFWLSSYPATGSVQFLKTSSPASDINLGGAAQGTLEFYVKKNEPNGSSIVSSARVNSGDGWTVVKDGQTPVDVGLAVPGDGRYEMKHDFAANAAGDTTATLFGGGISDRVVYDLTEIATLEGLNESFDPLSGEVKMADGRLILQHTGVKDYRDIATRLMSENNFSDIEIRAYKGHPDLPRDQWLLHSIWRCDDYRDTETALELTLVSVLERTKGRFPVGSGALFGYMLKSLDSDLTAGADFHKSLRELAETAATQAVSLAASATEESYAFTDAGIPNLSVWPRGKPFSAKLKVTVANANIFAKVRITRVNAAGAAQQSTVYTPEQQLSAVAGYVFTVPGITWTPGSAGDRLRVDYSFRNSAASIQAVTIEYNTVSTEVIAPWTPTLSVDPKPYSASTIQAAYLDWRDNVIGLRELYRGAPPANVEHLITYNFEGGLRDVDGKRILERIAYLAGDIVIASQGIIKAVPALRPTLAPVIFFPLTTTTITDVDLGLRARIPEFSVAYGWDTARRNAFAGEVIIKHQAALDAYSYSRIDNPARRAEDDLCRWVLTADLAFAIGLPIVQGIGMGFRRVLANSQIPYPEGELGDCVAVEVQTLTWKDPTSGRGYKGPHWAIGIIMGIPPANGIDGKLFDIWLPAWMELVPSSSVIWRRADRELPLVNYAITTPTGNPGLATIRLEAFPMTSTIYWFTSSTAGTAPDRDSPVWTVYSAPVTLARDQSNDKFFSFYAVSNGIPSPVTTVRVPPGKLQALSIVCTRDAGLVSPNIVVTWFAQQDPDIRRLRWYIKKNAWPTLSGLVGGTLDETFFWVERSIFIDGGGHLNGGGTTSGGTTTSHGNYNDTGDISYAICLGIDKDGNVTARASLAFTIPAAQASVAPASFTVTTS